MLNTINSIWTSFRANVLAMSEWWDRVPTAYRAAGCMLFALLLIWEATKAKGENEHDRKFFVQGLLALLILIYGAMLFTGGNAATSP
jgi:hypothetical protein